MPRDRDVERSRCREIEMHAGGMRGNRHGRRESMAHVHGTERDGTERRRMRMRPRGAGGRIRDEQRAATPPSSPKRGASRRAAESAVRQPGAAMLPSHLRRAPAYVRRAPGRVPGRVCTSVDRRVLMCMSDV